MTRQMHIAGGVSGGVTNAAAYGLASETYVIVPFGTGMATVVMSWNGAQCALATGESRCTIDGFDYGIRESSYPTGQVNRSTRGYEHE